jgi:hypothetical protein
MPELHTLVYANLIMPDVCTFYPLMMHELFIYFAHSHKTFEMVLACKLSRIVKIFHVREIFLFSPIKLVLKFEFLQIVYTLMS